MQDAIIILVLSLVAFYFFWFPAIKRVYAIKKIGNDLDIPFYPNGDKSLFEHLEHFHLFTIGHKSKIKNMLHQEDNETEIAFFDFTYILDAGGGEDIPVIERQQSVLYLCSSKLDLPQFALQPEEKYHQFDYLMDIDFSSHKKFSDDYLLQGNPEDSVRDLFNKEKLEFFESKSGLCIEGGGNQMLYYRFNDIINSNKVDEFMKEGISVLSKFMN